MGRCFLFPLLFLRFSSPFRFASFPFHIEAAELAPGAAPAPHGRGEAAIPCPALPRSVLRVAPGAAVAALMALARGTEEPGGLW